MDINRLGVIAGAFDPIHNGHINFIDNSIKEYGLDKVLILIEEKSKFKQSFADFSHRKKIVELSIKNKPEVKVYPAVTASWPISSTLPKIKSENPQAKFYLLIGDDVKDHISQWPGSDELLNNVEIIVADRSAAGGQKQVSSGTVRAQIKAGDAQVDMQSDALAYCRQNNLYN